MRVALTAWDGRISPVFDTARHLQVVDVDGGLLTGRVEEPLDEDLPDRRVARLAVLKVDALICGAISRPLADMVQTAGIQLVPFVAGPVEEVLRAYVKGTLPAAVFQMPGCCGGRGRFRRCRGRRGGPSPT
jgi:predicted Fe-Mo cluster-binding NifX family protein